MKKYLFNLLFILTTLSAAAQKYALTGRVTDNQNKPIGFVSIYVRNSTYGSTANENGRYQFSLSPGTYDVIYRYVGYIERIERITITDHNVDNSIVMQPEVFELRQVTITSRRKGPADSIMKQVIARRKYYLNQVPEYSSAVYVKGVQRLTKAPKKLLGRNIPTLLELDSNGRGILYQSESLSEFNFKQPDKVKEVMIASKIAGQSSAFSYNKASDLQVNFYKNVLQINGLSTRGFVSPIADNAMSFYRYRLAGVSIENGRRIDKIEVIPRHEHDPVYRGFIYILENSYRLYSADLTLTRQANINLVDSLNISQQYIPVRDSVWLPVSTQYTYSGDVLGFGFKGYYASIYNNYNLNPGFKEGFFDGEVMRIDTTANIKTEAYWSKTRPVPLTLQEARDYHIKDSIGRIEHSRPYLDSVERANNKFNPLKYTIFGYAWTDRYAGRSFYLNPLYETLFYNTVEGFGINLKGFYTQFYNDRRSFTISPAVRYGFSNKKLEANVHLTYNYDPLHQGYWFGTFGSDILDLNNAGTRSNVFNTVSTLLSRSNYVKYYRSTFGLIGYQRELAKGVLLYTGLSYAQREQLYNTSGFSILGSKDKPFTTNNPLNPAGPDSYESLFPRNNAMTFKASVTFTFDQRYTTRPDGRFYEQSKYPKIRINYRKGINALGSSVDYDFASVDVFDDRIPTGLYGYTAFKLSAGNFFNKNNLYFMDYQHFFGNQGTVFNPTIGSFHYLPFYTFSTNGAYFEGHLEHNFTGSLFNKISFLRPLKLDEIIGANYLSGSAGRRNYSEFYVGIQRFIFRIDYGIAFEGSKKLNNSISIFYGLK
ncbi:DUF5686 and carboxypeptidase regulatory-like domain-containing protein [Mucilaginibacter ginkgonis]|uniref:Carboxypeptidase-like regulatory domain-containing protein n=1 Tax=Mucilaginibacter ginkgonis TaxID=2682091 RepID=A0A6I4INW0_9SPHI|nr:DUF5686 and carboxypeptidase regulatory-like domain-containing protein [Mucilaginibacter ginkgonis]QQL48924.1 carboxypeptidase-like regulatory domain-containing protein [Mucilaginibacter ginkgonis]